MTQCQTFFFALITLFWSSWKKVQNICLSVFILSLLDSFLFNSWYKILCTRIFSFILSATFLFLNSKKERLFGEVAQRNLNRSELDWGALIQSLWIIMFISLNMKLPCETLEGNLQPLCITPHCYSYFVAMACIIIITGNYFVRKRMTLHYLKFAVLDGFAQLLTL